MTDQEIQDQLNRMQINVQTLLGILDPSFDNIVKMYLTRAINYVKSYCKITEIPTDLESVVEDIAVFKYRLKGVEGIQSEGKGSLSETYAQSLPVDIVKELNKYRRLNFV